MDKLLINGGRRLVGEVSISGAKNAVAAIIPAILLSDGVCVIENLPNISDVSNAIHILYELGAQVKRLDKHTVQIDPTHIQSWVLPAEMSSRMRSSSYFLGAFLGRFKKARVAPPGGCDFGVRPLDLHIKGFEALGAKVIIENGMIDARAKNLLGSPIYLDKVSVGATANIMLAAVKAQGLTIIENAAKEPHVVDLANFLNSMGADIMGAGTNVIKIRGVSQLGGTTYSIIPDQIEAGTYMVAAAATCGDVLIKNVIPKHLESITAKLQETGVQVTEYDEAVRVTATGRPKACNVMTLPHPGFPTDMQPQMATYLTIAEGVSVVTEGIWDNRFRYIDQLTLMGAQVQVDSRVAVVRGVPSLKSAPLSSTDLRAGAAFVIAGLMAQGETEVSNLQYLDRGYEDIVEKLVGLGADIRRVTVFPEAKKAVL